MNIFSITFHTKSMIDDLKAVCTNFGLGNAASEYKIITEVFLYKFLNDKFIYEMKKKNPAYESLADTEVEQRLSALSDDEYEMALMDIGGSTAKLHPKQFISYLFNHQNDEKFHKLFDDTLVAISNDNMDIFSVQAGTASKIKLFDPLSPYVIEEEKRDAFCKAMIGKLVNDSFTGVFEQKYDFFADIFEYLIKDYNKDSGKYAEYYTPHSIATILARILVPEAVQNVTVYDPAAGTGTLVLALAHEIGANNCTIYTQDISQKANEFMRLNLILNGLVHSLPNVVHDDTLVSPRHLNARKDNIATFDYIASNPPFNMDFSETRDTLAGEAYQKRFFAGVPNIPNLKVEKMPIYLMFLQHIIVSLNEKGKAAVVVPTGFLTAGSGIPLKIRQRLVDNHMLRGVVSMPSNIFANTGTNVSVLFIDKQHTGDVILMDASKLGSKVKMDDNNQRTVLSDAEIEQIMTDPTSQLTFDEAIVALACCYRDVSYSTLAKRNIGALSDDITKAPYTVLMNSGTNSFSVINAVQIVRRIDSYLLRKKTEIEGKERLVVVHGNRFIEYRILQMAQNKEGFNDSVMKIDEIMEEFIQEVDNLIPKITDIVNQEFPESYPANIFKNATKCKIINEKI